MEDKVNIKLTNTAIYQIFGISNRGYEIKKDEVIIFTTGIQDHEMSLEDFLEGVKLFNSNAKLDVNSKEILIANGVAYKNSIDRK